MAHRRRRGSRQMSLLSGRGSITGTLKRIAIGAAPTLTFLSAISSKDQAALNQQTSFVGRAKTMANIVTGHATGFNAFNDVPKFQASMNPGGIFGPLTMASIGGTVAGVAMELVGKKLGIAKVASGGRDIKRVAGASIVPAMVGYFLDPPVAENKPNPGYVTYNQPSPSMAVNHAPALTESPSPFSRSGGY